MTTLPAPESFQHQLLQHLLAGVIVHAPDTRILFANDEAARVTGLSVDQLTGKVARDPAWSFVREDGTPMPVEEYPVNQILATSDYLHAQGFAVTVARTGPVALAAAVAHPPDLILMDVQLPELDGLALMRQLRTMPTLATTPIIALTALSMPHDRERCLAAGATAYLSKPVRLKELVRLIDQLLQG